MPVIGGKQLVVHYLTTFINKNEYDCKVLTNKNKDIKNANFQYRVYKLPINSKFFPVLIKLIWLLLLNIRIKIDLIHAHRTYPAGFCAVIFGRLCSIPTVITPHGDDILTVPQINYGINLKKRLRRKSIYALKNADAVVAFNKGMKAQVINLGAKPDKVHCIPIGINLENLNNNITKQTKFNKGKTIIAIGRNHPIKDYETLLNAIAIANKKDPEIKCIIVGKNSNNLIKIVNTLGIQNNVELKKVIKNTFNKGIPEKLIDLYRKSDIYISTSLSESFSLTILEAMAMGLSVIATDTIGSRGLIENNKNGFIVPVNNPKILAKRIINLTNDYSLQNKFSERAKSKAKSKKYSWEDISLKHSKLYNQLISNYGEYS